MTRSYSPNILNVKLIQFVCFSLANVQTASVELPRIVDAHAQTTLPSSSSTIGEYRGATLPPAVEIRNITQCVSTREGNYVNVFFSFFLFLKKPSDSIKLNYVDSCGLQSFH